MLQASQCCEEPGLEHHDGPGWVVAELGAEVTRARRIDMPMRLNFFMGPEVNFASHGLSPTQPHPRQNQQ